MILYVLSSSIVFNKMNHFIYKCNTIDFFFTIENINNDFSLILLINLMPSMKSCVDIVWHLAIDNLKTYTYWIFTRKTDFTFYNEWCLKDTWKLIAYIFLIMSILALLWMYIDIEILPVRIINCIINTWHIFCLYI